jgi:hypothetical protein
MSVDRRHLTLVPDTGAEAPTARPSGRQFTAHARALRDGEVVCDGALVVVHGLPAGLGVEARDDITAWFYGALDEDFEADLETAAAAARQYRRDPELPTVDLELASPAGRLELKGCRLRPPVRHAGPANTLEYRISHGGEHQRPRLSVIDAA